MNGGVAPLVLNLALYEWVRTVSARLLKPEEKTVGVPLKEGPLAFRAGPEAMARQKSNLPFSVVQPLVSYCVDSAVQKFG